MAETSSGGVCVCTAGTMGFSVGDAFTVGSGTDKSWPFLLGAGWLRGFSARCCAPKYGLVISTSFGAAWGSEASG